MIEARGLTRHLPGRQTRPSRPCAASTSTWGRARWSPSSARTAPASRPPCGCSRRCCSRRRGPPGWSAATSPRTRRASGSRIGYIGQGNSAGHTQQVLRRAGGPGPLLRARAPRGGRAAARRCSRRSTSRASASARSAPCRAASGDASTSPSGMVHRPALLFLDEPSTGLDPQNRANLQSQIERLRSDHGTTIVLTTHYLDEADALADRVVVVDHGVVIADDTPERLKAELAGDHIVITAADDGRRARRGRGASSARGGAAAAESSRRRGHRPGARRRRRWSPGLLRDLDRAGVDGRRGRGRAGPPSTTCSSTLTGRSLREGGDRAEPRLPTSTWRRPTDGPPSAPSTTATSDLDPAGEGVMSTLATDTSIVLDRELRPMLSQPGLAHLHAGPAARVPGAVRPAAAAGQRVRHRHVAAVVRARHRRHVGAGRHVDDRLEPAARDADRAPTSGCWSPRCGGRRCWSGGRSRRSCRSWSRR